MAVYGVLDHLLGGMIYKWAKKTPKCKACKARMHKKDHPPLFLLPVFYGEDYPDSPEYYMKNCVPIPDMQAIPTGQRACRMWTLMCPECGGRSVLVEDFLKVRDTEVLEKRRIYESGQIDLLKLSQK